MVIYDFLNFRDLYFLPILGENQTVWMYQINSVLFLPVSLQRMASPDVTGNHHLNGICSAYFCDSLLNLTGTKGKFICAQNGVTEEEFLDYGFRQIVNSILEARI